MKNIFIISTIFCLLIIFSACEKDNMAGPDATFFGSVKDSVDGSLVEQDMLTGSSIYAYEHGYETPTALKWDFKINGEFRNNLVFANTYDLYLRNGNFFPVTKMDFVIKPGDNNFDFIVVPYLRVKDANIIWDQSGNKIIASFKVEGGSPNIKLKKIEIFAFKDIYVGNAYKVAITKSASNQVFSPVITPDATTVYTLSIDIAANAKVFVTGRDYFFRIGALADEEGLSGVKFNYATYVKIRL